MAVFIFILLIVFFVIGFVFGCICCAVLDVKRELKREAELELDGQTWHYFPNQSKKFNMKKFIKAAKELKEQIKKEQGIVRVDEDIWIYKPKCNIKKEEK